MGRGGSPRPGRQQSGGRNAKPWVGKEVHLSLSSVQGHRVAVSEPERSWPGRGARADRAGTALSPLSVRPGLGRAAHLPVPCGNAGGGGVEGRGPGQSQMRRWESWRHGAGGARGGWVATGAQLAAAG